MRQDNAEAGYIDVKLTLTPTPLNAWPENENAKTIGMWSCESMITGISGISMAVLTRGCGWTAMEVGEFLVNVRKELKVKSIHTYLNL